MRKVRAGAASDRAGDSRPQLHQTPEIAAVQRKRVDGLIAYRAAERGVGGVNGGDFSRYRNRLRLLAGLYRQVHANVLAYFHQHTAVLHGPETLCHDPNRIGAGR